MERVYQRGVGAGVKKENTRGGWGGGGGGGSRERIHQRGLGAGVRNEHTKSQGQMWRLQSETFLAGEGG